MNKKAISVSIICMMLTASFVITSMTASKSKVKHVTSSPQQKAVKPDPPGTILGATNPELIPDHMAYTLVFRTVALRQGTDFERARSRAWGMNIGLDKEATNKLIEVATEFEAELSKLDLQAKEIKDRTWPNPDAAVMGQLTALQNKKEALVAKTVASLPARLGVKPTEIFREHTTVNMKRRMKIAPVSANPIGKHH